VLVEIEHALHELRIDAFDRDTRELPLPRVTSISAR